MSQADAATARELTLENLRKLLVGKTIEAVDVTDWRWDDDFREVILRLSTGERVQVVPNKGDDGDAAAVDIERLETP